jgi:hypothetical protein
VGMTCVAIALFQEPPDTVGLDDYPPKMRSRPVAQKNGFDVSLAAPIRPEDSRNRSPILGPHEEA